MQCEDNSKLRIPLPEVCQTTDIGCVPIVDGKPTCSPQPDELPFAFDPKTTTLWIFSCDTREWINFTKFNVCQLDALNLDNITNICDILNIAVNYSGSGECKQGTITLGELAERILECLKLETKIITIGEGEGNKVKITIEGLPLDPVYVTGRNIWSEGGSGTEADPLKVATYDPICKWPTRTQAQVDAASVKHLGACLDGEMSRIPLPPKVCELPSKSQAQVDAAASKELIACLDGEGSKVPFPLMPCEYRQMTEEQVAAAQDKNLIACVDGDNVKVPYPGSPCTFPQITPDEMMAASDKDFIACVNGQNVKVPVPGNLYESSPCSAPDINLDQARVSAENQTLKFVACDGMNMIKVPVHNSGFFDRDYICVPEVTGVPSAAPLQGTGPLRIDCNGTLWVWLCDLNVWARVKDGIAGIPDLDPGLIPDICNNFRMKGWFANNSDPCVQDVQFTLMQLADLVKTCIISTTQCHDPITTDEFPNFPFIQNGKDGKRDFQLKNIKLADISSDEMETYGRYIGVYNARSRSWTYGSVNDDDTKDNYSYGVKKDEMTDEAGKTKVVITNDLGNGCRMTYRITNGVQLIQEARGYGTGNAKDYRNDFSVAVISRATTDPSMSWGEFSTGGTAPTRRTAALNWNSKSGFNQGDWVSKHFSMREGSNSLVATVGSLGPGESITYYIHTFLVITSAVQNLEENRFIVGGFGGYVDLEKFRGALI